MPTAEYSLPREHAERLVDAGAYADGRVYDTYRWLRAKMPLGLAEPDGYDPFWVVTRHADILEVSRNNQLFRSAVRSTTITDKENDRRTRAITGGSPNLVRTLVHMDAPDHPKFRALTQAWFLPQNIRKLEERIRSIARKAVDGLAAKGGRCDFVSDVALHYPLRVIMEILGVPEEDFPRMLTLTQELLGPLDPEKNPREKTMPMADALNATVEDFVRYFAQMTGARRAQPGGDLASVISNARIGGELLSDHDAFSYYIIIATAGHDTTSASTAGAVWALAENPGQFVKIKADRSLIPGLVDEAIRWTSPVKNFMRTASAQTELCGRPIAKDDWLMLCYASGNRDESAFDVPQSFRIDRKPNPHLAFGYGAHLCLGQHLAKMEMRIFFEELIPRLKSLELAGEPRMSRALFVCGPKSVPIRYELE